MLHDLDHSFHGGRGLEAWRSSWRRPEWGLRPTTPMTFFLEPNTFGSWGQGAGCWQSWGGSSWFAKGPRWPSSCWLPTLMFWPLALLGFSAERMKIVLFITLIQLVDITTVFWYHVAQCYGKNKEQWHMPLSPLLLWCSWPPRVWRCPRSRVEVLW